jgi:hypothetical protein
MLVASKSILLSSGSKPVDVTPVLEHIDAITKPGVNNVITSESTLPSTEINSQLKSN